MEGARGCDGVRKIVLVAANTLYPFDLAVTAG
jgi:hypothetical protein